MKSKLISTILAAAMTLSAVTLPMPLKTNAEADSLIARKFDLGGLGAADGYIGVSASEGYVTNEILQPIGMTNSGYHIPTTQGYRWFFRKLLPYDEPEFVMSSGDGGLRSTPKDMTLWIEAQLGHSDLPEKLERAIAASHETPEAYEVKLENGVVQYNGSVCGYHILF